MNVRVKICGVTTPEDVRLAADAGADAVGLNFYPTSPTRSAWSARMPWTWPAASSPRRAAKTRTRCGGSSRTPAGRPTLFQLLEHLPRQRRHDARAVGAVEHLGLAAEAELLQHPQ